MQQHKENKLFCINRDVTNAYIHINKFQSKTNKVIACYLSLN